MAHGFSSPLVSVPGSGPQGQPQVGDLLTVKLFGGKVSGARLERVSCGTYFVKLVGLDIPQPYELGLRLPLNREAIIDWGAA